MDANTLVSFGTDSGRESNAYRIQGLLNIVGRMDGLGWITQIQAIRSASRVNAKFLDIDDKSGTIENGNQAI